MSEDVLRSMSSAPSRSRRSHLDVVSLHTCASAHGGTCPEWNEELGVRQGFGLNFGNCSNDAPCWSKSLIQKQFPTGTNSRASSLILGSRPASGKL
jgi:hypothetical protein